MDKAFLDASALVAYFNREDEFHTNVAEIIDSKKFEFYTSDVALLETQYVLWRKVGAQNAINTTSGILEAEDITVLESTNRDLLEEIEIFKSHQMPSFDALICALMRREDIKILVSYDRAHFETVPFVSRIERMGQIKRTLSGTSQ